MGNFQEVVRAKSKLRMALTGVSGAGETLGALYIAFGLTGDWSKIAVIDTEHELSLIHILTFSCLHETTGLGFDTRKYYRVVQY